MKAINLMNLHRYKENKKKICSLDGKGHDTIKLCYVILHRLIYLDLKTYNIDIWKGVSPSKTEFILWFAMHNRLCTRFFFITRKIIMMYEDICRFCISESETTTYILGRFVSSMAKID